MNYIKLNIWWNFKLETFLKSRQIFIYYQRNLLSLASKFVLINNFEIRIEVNVNSCKFAQTLNRTTSTQFAQIIPEINEYCKTGDNPATESTPRKTHKFNFMATLSKIAAENEITYCVAFQWIIL